MNKLYTLFLFTVIITIAGQTQIGNTIYSPEMQSEARFGQAVKINSTGTIVAVGAPTWNHPTYGQNVGEVNIFEYDSNADTWSPLGGQLTTNNGLSGYGIGLDISDAGTTVIIGAPFYQQTTAIPRIGLVQVFEYNGTDWLQKGQTFLGTQAGERLGGRLSMSADGNVIAFGGQQYDFNGQLDPGHVLVYQYEGTSLGWQPMGSELIGDSESDRLATPIINDAGTRMIVGAPIGEAANGDRPGYVKIMDWDGTNWVQVGSTIYGDADEDQFGFAAAFANDNKFAVSARYHNGEAGQVKIFTFDGTDWVQEGSDIVGVVSDVLVGTNTLVVGERLGTSLSFNEDGTTLAIGCPSNSENGNLEQGKVRFYDFDGTTWVENTNVLDINVPSVRTNMGVDVDFAGQSTLAVGTLAYLNNNNETTGAAQVFDIIEFLSVEDIEALEPSAIELLPSIATQNVQLVGEDLNSVKGIAVYNAEGKRVLYYPSQISEFEVSNLASGVYFVVLDMQNGKQESLKFIKK